MTKQEIRKVYLAKRLSLSEEEQSDRWQSIFHFIERHIKVKRQTAILSYLPLSNKNEMDTRLFNQFMVDSFDSTITYPRLIGDDFLPFETGKDTPIVQTNKFNLLEPDSTKKVPPEELSLVLTPLFIFDKQGYRVGYGKGMYDRFLTSVSPTCIILGCSFFEPIDFISDVGAWDKTLNIGITPTQIFKFN